MQRVVTCVSVLVNLLTGMKCPLSQFLALQPFDKWVVSFIGPINPPTWHSGARYIITVTDYLTRWAETAPTADCSYDTATQFIFYNIITRVGCPRSLMSDQGSHFVNKIVATLTREFMIQHHRSIPYHPQGTWIVEAFNKILEHGLTKICAVNRDDWDERIPAVLWAYRTTTKNWTKHTPFRLVCDREAVVPTEFIVPGMLIAQVTHMKDYESLKERLAELMSLEEYGFLHHFTRI